MSPAIASTTFTVTRTEWGNPDTEGSFAWAIQQANLTAGEDVILLAPNGSNTISVDVNPLTGDPQPVVSSFLARITESVRIEGNGVTLEGNPVLISTGGTVYDKFTITKPVPGDIEIPAFSFAEVGSPVQGQLEGAGIRVEINRMNLDGLNGFLKVGKDAVATIADSSFKNTIFYGFSGRSVIDALEGSMVTLEGVVLDRINPFFSEFGGAEYAWEGAIAGTNATINISESIIRGSSTSLGGLNLLGGTANIVSSIFTGDAGGLSVRDNEDGTEGVLNFVNSLFRPEDAEAEVARVQAFAGGVANLIASTVQVNGLITFTGGLGCEREENETNYRCNGSPLQAFDGGVINLMGSAVSAINMQFPPIDRPYSETYDRFDAGDLRADPFSYVQPAGLLTSADLEDLFSQDALITEGEPFALDAEGLLYFPVPEGAAPQDPLLGRIPDADGVNQLINPIDGSVIRRDVFGNPRTAYGSRDIGAVQASQEQVPGPLPLFGLGASYRWTRRLRTRIRAVRRW